MKLATAGEGPDRRASLQQSDLSLKGEVNSLCALCLDQWRRVARRAEMRFEVPAQGAIDITHVGIDA